LARAVVDLVDMGLVKVYQSRDVESEARLVPVEDVPAVVTDTRNWYTDEGTLSIVELADTDAAGPVLATSDDIYSYRHHS
jgi:hypothetical protein